MNEEELGLRLGYISMSSKGLTTFYSSKSSRSNRGKGSIELESQECY